MRKVIKKYLHKFGYDIVKKDNDGSIFLNKEEVRRNSFFPDYGVFDTSVGSKNLGDFIIMEAVNFELSNLFNDKAYFTTFPTHLRVEGEDRKLFLEKELIFLGGTNLLNARMDEITQWRVSKCDWNFLSKRCVLMGVGWGGYDGDASNGTKEMLKTVLSDKVLHSVRDEYTKDMLKSIGIDNVINTCCPTTWGITVDKTNRYKKKNVVTTITDYSLDIEKDSWMINYLLSNYEKVFIWIQSIEDLYCLEKMKIKDKERLIFISPSLNAYREFLDSNSNDIDYVGTRLHAGIYAMQRNIRTLIIGIDNRALEIAKDVKINVVNRLKIEEIESFIVNDYGNNINLPTQEIMNWKNELLTGI